MWSESSSYGTYYKPHIFVMLCYTTLSCQLYFTQQVTSSRDRFDHHNLQIFSTINFYYHYPFAKPVIKQFKMKASAIPSIMCELTKAISSA